MKAWKNEKMKKWKNEIIKELGDIGEAQGEVSPILLCFKLINFI